MSVTAPLEFVAHLYASYWPLLLIAASAAVGLILATTARNPEEK